ncbi:hypothetical protein AAMO2058_000789000 [Amorphochlora amoebiformis]
MRPRCLHSLSTLMLPAILVEGNAPCFQRIALQSLLKSRGSLFASGIAGKDSRPGARMPTGVSTMCKKPGGRAIRRLNTAMSSLGSNSKANSASAKFDFSNHTVVITGGSSGIGLAIAREFERAGAVTWVTGTRGAATDYDQDLGGLLYRQVRMEDKDDVDILIDELTSLDILINCAGFTVRGESAYTLENFSNILDVNLNSAFYLSNKALPMLKAAERGGCVVNILSMMSYFGSPGSPGYAASKAGMLGLTRSLSMAWAKEGVRVNGVAPGWIKTKLTDYWRSEEVKDSEAAILHRTPMKRWGTPQEVAGAVLFLASDAAKFITGATINVDGGYSAA